MSQESNSKEVVSRVYVLKEGDLLFTDLWSELHEEMLQLGGELVQDD